MTRPAFRVVWPHSVRAVWVGERLLELAANGESGQRIFDAIDRITSFLSIDPEGEGESRPDATRIYHDSPLTVTYEVHPEEGVVIVVNAHYVRRPGNPSA